MSFIIAPCVFVQNFVTPQPVMLSKTTAQGQRSSMSKKQLVVIK
jgi:hypothetical protein